jgi:lysophospholipase L1-like esterase
MSARAERVFFALWCVALLVAAEFVSRCFVPLEQVPRWHGFHVGDSVLAYRMAPNLDGRIWFTRHVPIRTNRLGLRDREYGPRTPGVRRVLTIGDSQTLGLVPEPHTLARRLERELEAAGGDWEVINAGVLGYGTEQELDHLRRLLPVYQPDLVVLTVFPNDVFDNRFDPRARWYVGEDGYLHSRTEAPVPLPGLRPGLAGAHDWLARNVNLYALATRAGTRLAHATRGATRPSIRPDYARLLAKDRDAAERRDWARTDSLLGEVVTAARAGGAKVLLVDGGNRAALSWAMWPADTDTGAYDLDQQARLLAATAARAGAPMVHVMEAFRAAPASPALYVAGDDHWTPAGFEVAARQIAPAIRDILGDDAPAAAR